MSAGQPYTLTSCCRLLKQRQPERYVGNDCTHRVEQDAIFRFAANRDPFQHHRPDANHTQSAAPLPLQQI